MKVNVDEVQKAISNSKTVILSANCTIKYSGRAESYLPSGDRLIIIKADNTLLVHQPTGNNPINYMKEGTSHKILTENGQYVLKSQNLALKEYMNIFFNEIYFINFQALEDGEKIQLSGSEKDMSDMIFNNPHLISSDFTPLSREEHTKFGFVDVFGHDKENILIVVECKRFTADLKAIDQLNRYVEKIKQTKGLEKVRGIIAAPNITPNATSMLQNYGFEYRQVNPPKYQEKYDADQKKLGEY